MANLNKESAAIIAAFGKEPGVTADHIKQLNDVLEASATLTDQFNDAVAQKHLKRLVPLTNPNAGGEYAHPEMRLPLSSLTAANKAELTFVLGHELQHGFNHAAMQQAYKHFNNSVDSKAKEATPPRDYTDAVATLIESNRQNEAGAEIAGWNAIVSMVKKNNANPTLQEIYLENPGRMKDFIIESTGAPKAYRLRSNLTLNSDMTMSADAKNLEGMGQNYFDKPANQTNLGPRGTSDYTNYYGAYAVGVIERAERGQHPLKAGVTPEPIALDMGRLRFNEKLIEENGVHLGVSTQALNYVDSGKTPPTAGLFQHTAKTHTHVLPISAQFYEDARSAMLREPAMNPSHQAHAPRRQESPTTTPPAFTPPAAPQIGEDMRAAGHPGHASYKNALQRVELFENLNRITYGPHTERLAAALAVYAERERVNFHDTFVEKDDNGGLRLVQKDFGSDAPPRHMPIDARAMSSQSIEDSTRQWLQTRSAYYTSASPQAPSAAPEEQALLAKLPEPDQALYARIRSEVPASIGDAQLVQAVVEVKQAGITDARQIALVALAGDRLIVRSGIETGLITAAVDVSAPTPAMHESVGQLQAFEEQRQQQLAHAALQPEPPTQGAPMR